MAPSRSGFFLFCLLSLVNASVLSRDAQADEVTASGKSSRSTPKERAPLDISLCADEPTFWRRALSLVDVEYCRHVHRGQANLWARPELAEKYVREALILSPQGVVAQLLLGESALYQGRSEEAHLQLSKWMALAPAAGLTSQVRVSAARAALLSGNYVDAAREYRGTILRLDDFSSEREQTRILIEAATAVAYSSPTSGREVRGYLAIARQKSAPLLVETITAAWTLSLYREGRLKEASAIAQSLSDSWTISWIVERQKASRGLPSEVLPVLPPGEGMAMAAAVAEAIEPEHAADHWQSFREQASLGWPQHIERVTPGTAADEIEQ